MNTCKKQTDNQQKNQVLAKMVFKRRLIRFQKGVSKGLKEHLLKAKRALIENQLTLFYFPILEFYLQNKRKNGITKPIWVKALVKAYSIKKQFPILHKMQPTKNVVEVRKYHKEN